MRIAQFRIGPMNEFASGEHVSLKAFDNMNVSSSVYTFVKLPNCSNV
jgi:hypothetical protein